MFPIFRVLTNGKTASLLISLILTITLLDSQFINLFYASNFGAPDYLNLILFLFFVIFGFAINTILLLRIKGSLIQDRTSRPLLFKGAYVGTLCIQFGLFLIIAIMISEMFIFHSYSKELSLLVTYFSHLWSAIVLGILTFVFFQWFKFSRSFSILIYTIVFGLIVVLVLFTIPLLTEQVENQPSLIVPRDYTTLVADLIAPSPDIAFIYGLGSYVLPLMIIASWILTVSLLKRYIVRIGMRKFWLLVSVPLLYELLTYVIRNTNLISDPNLVAIIYSQGFQYVFSVSYQVSGLFFAIAFLSIATKMNQQFLKTYMMVLAIGVASLFSSIQPGAPFYAAFPPFGIVTLTFLGLSSYLMLVGMLGSATYFSRDSELRQQIYKSVELDSDLLKKIGMAEMQREMERKILPLHKKFDSSQEPQLKSDFSEEDIKMIIQDALNEVSARKSNVKSDQK